MLLAQISDTHVTPEHRQPERGTAPAARLARVVAHVLALPVSPDAVILSGDLADLGTVEEYRLLRALLAPLAMPVYLMPGNHDCRGALREVFFDHRYLALQGTMHYAVNDYAVRLLMLDTVIEGEDGGRLDDAQLAWLEEKLDESAAQPVMIFMHHPPVLTGIRRIDEINVAPPGASRLARLVERHGGVQAIACGHVHRGCEVLWHRTRVSICPSVAYQAQVDVRDDGDFIATGEPPGYQAHYWNGAQVVTHCIAVT
jgi:3',5'-cyclic AMP phosphodiesterase CpdA